MWRWFAAAFVAALLVPASAQAQSTCTFPAGPKSAVYSVVIDSVAGSLGAIVIQMSFGGGDGAMIYEGAFR